MFSYFLITSYLNTYLIKGGSFFMVRLSHIISVLEIHHFDTNFISYPLKLKFLF